MIKIYLDTHREACLDGIDHNDLEDDEIAYDKHIGDYIKFLETEAEIDGIKIETSDNSSGFSYHADTEHEDVWMMGHLNFWEWYQAGKPMADNIFQFTLRNLRKTENIL